MAQGGRRILLGLLIFAFVASFACSAGAPRSLAPNGPVPAQWKVYQGGKVQFAIAYPPSWMIDEAEGSVGSISFLSTSAGATITRQVLRKTAQLSVLRDRYLTYALRGCETGKTLRGTASILVSGISFATSSAGCGAEHENAGDGSEAQVYYTGVGVRGSSEWMFLFHADADEFAQRQHDEFDPMLMTLKILGTKGALAG
jgi:hypothetical protein